MTIGPVQLLVLGFDLPDFDDEILDELGRLKENDLVRLIDWLAVYKDTSGNVTVVKAGKLSSEEAAEVGALVGALVGIGAGGDNGTVAGSADGPIPDDAWDVLAEIPDDSAAALILLEHRWAIPLRDAVARARGFRLASEFINPLDLVALGLVTAEVAEELASAEKDAL